MNNYTKDQIQLILKEYRNNFDIKHSIFISNIKDHPQYNIKFILIFIEVV